MRVLLRPGPGGAGPGAAPRPARPGRRRRRPGRLSGPAARPRRARRAGPHACWGRCWRPAAAPAAAGDPRRVLRHRRGHHRDGARRLHLSVRAVTYRLARVAALLGGDPTDPAERFDLHAAVLGGASRSGWPGLTHLPVPRQYSSRPDSSGARTRCPRPRGPTVDGHGDKPSRLRQTRPASEECSPCSMFRSGPGLTFGALVLVMLAVDLLAHRGAHVIGFREAAWWCALWVGLSLAFGGGRRRHPRHATPASSSPPPGCWRRACPWTTSSSSP